MIPKRTELPVLFGEIKNGIWIEQAKHLKKVTIPNFLKPYWKYDGREVSSMLVNKVMEKPLYLAWTKINDAGLAHHIYSFDGCFVIRQSRKDNRPSVHSWALAIDINAATNALGVQPLIAPQLVACFKAAGFVWGGDWKTPDGMHFQYVIED